MHGGMHGEELSGGTQLPGSATGPQRQPCGKVCVCVCVFVSRRLIRRGRRTSAHLTAVPARGGIAANVRSVPFNQCTVKKNHSSHLTQSGAVMAASCIRGAHTRHQNAAESGPSLPPNPPPPRWRARPATLPVAGTVALRADGDVRRLGALLTSLRKAGCYRRRATEKCACTLNASAIQWMVRAVGGRAMMTQVGLPSFFFGQRVPVMPETSVAHTRFSLTRNGWECQLASHMWQLRSEAGVRSGRVVQLTIPLCTQQRVPFVPLRVSRASCSAGGVRKLRMCSWKVQAAISDTEYRLR